MPRVCEPLQSPCISLCCGGACFPSALPVTWLVFSNKTHSPEEEALYQLHFLASEIIANRSYSSILPSMCLGQVRNFVSPQATSNSGIANKDQKRNPNRGKPIPSRPGELKKKPKIEMHGMSCVCSCTLGASLHAICTENTHILPSRQVETGPLGFHQ